MKFLGDDKTIVRFYIAGLATSEPLSRDREIDLAARIKKGDIEARNELVQANLRFVVSMAQKYQDRGLAFSELISAGNLGLITAAERFDGNRGYKFISYAVWWVKQAMLESIMEQVRTVRLPQNKVALLRAISKATKRLRRERDSVPEEEELAEELDVSVQQIQDAMLGASMISSLDDVSQMDESRCLLDILPDTNQAPPDAKAIQESDRALLGRVLASLNNREQFVIRSYFGLDRSEKLTLDEIGDIMGVTRERIRQIREGALDKLRHPSRFRSLQLLKYKT